MVSVCLGVLVDMSGWKFVGGGGDDFVDSKGYWVTDVSETGVRHGSCRLCARLYLAVS
jgi:hypothetical protein